MRREQRISDRLYHHLFPRPGPSDPPNFNAHLNTNLVAEVRIETQRFYGGLETVEARYPGLNYTYPPHVKRLSYFPHHARLFHAFKELGLTHGEILGLCRWEGTLWARQRYENDEGVKVEDTTGNEIKPWQPQIKKEVEMEQKVAGRRANRPLSRRSHLSSPRVQQQSTVSGTARSAPLVQVTTEEVPATGARDVEMHDESDTQTPQETAEGPAQSALSPTEAFQRMQALAALRANGETIEAMDPEFEQYLKDTAEASPSGTQGVMSLDYSSGYHAAQTIATVMSTVAQTQGAAAANAEVASSATSNADAATLRDGAVPQVDVL